MSENIEPGAAAGPPPGDPRSSSPAADRARWEDRYARRAVEPRAPSAWLLERCLELPADAVIVDVAGGDGRHAAPLAARGRRVVVVDFVERAVRAATAAHPGVLGVVTDVAALPFGPGTLDAVLVANFLERRLVPALLALLRPGGHFVMETYTIGQRALVESGRARAPRSAAYLLAPGELPALVAPLEIVAYREGHVRDAAGERYSAGVVAVKGG